MVDEAPSGRKYVVQVCANLPGLRYLPIHNDGSSCVTWSPQMHWLTCPVDLGGGQDRPAIPVPERLPRSWTGLDQTDLTLRRLITVMTYGMSPGLMAGSSAWGNIPDLYQNLLIRSDWEVLLGQGGSTPLRLKGTRK